MLNWRQPLFTDIGLNAIHVENVYFFFLLTISLKPAALDPCQRLTHFHCGPVEQTEERKLTASSFVLADKNRFLSNS